MTNDDDCCHVGTKDLGVIGLHVSQGNRCHRFRVRVTERRVICGKEPFAHGSSRKIGRTFQLPDERLPDLLFDDGKCLFRKSRPQQIVRQEFHASFEMDCLDLQRKGCARHNVGGDIILSCLEGDSVEGSRSIGKEALQEL
ncbi:MAG: hypothetical protein CSYNP_04098 [Syntrophus sp. SKADARSKE-3]|nr:hypothetical protein [Syntrophus sp. SKADARSKE-3]